MVKITVIEFGFDLSVKQSNQSDQNQSHLFKLIRKYLNEWPFTFVLKDNLSDALSAVFIHMLNRDFDVVCVPKMYVAYLYKG